MNILKIIDVYNDKHYMRADDYNRTTPLKRLCKSNGEYHKARDGRFWYTQPRLIHPDNIKAVT